MVNTHSLDSLSTRARAIQLRNQSFVQQFLYDQNGKDLVDWIRIVMMDMVVHNRGDLMRRMYDRMPSNIQSNPERFITAFHIAYNKEIGGDWDLNDPAIRNKKFI